MKLSSVHAVNCVSIYYQLHVSNDICLISARCHEFDSNEYTVKDILWIFCGIWGVLLFSVFTKFSHLTVVGWLPLRTRSNCLWIYCGTSTSRLLSVVSGQRAIAHVLSLSPSGLFCWRNFRLVRKFSCKNTKFGLKCPIFEEFSGKVDIFSTPNSFLSEICSWLSAFPLF